MKKDIKKQWVDRLRNGGLTQAQGTLKRVDSNGNVSYCCLGVLCEMAVEAGVIQPAVATHGTIESGYMHGYPVDERDDAYREDGLLPQVVSRWAGIEGKNPSYSTESSLTLANENDSGRSFAKIADLIEKSDVL